MTTHAVRATLTTMTTTPQIDEGLNAIREAAANLYASDRALRFLVMTTKLQGATWQQIGDVLGTTRQSAQERFSKYVDGWENYYKDSNIPTGGTS